MQVIDEVMSEAISVWSKVQTGSTVLEKIVNRG